MLAILKDISKGFHWNILLGKNALKTAYMLQRSLKALGAMLVRSLA